METLFYALECFKILTILIFICLAGLAASTINLKKSNNNRSKTLLDKMPRISQNAIAESDKYIAKNSSIIDINKLDDNVYIEQKITRK